MIFERKSGVLLHPTSLPGRYGVGSFDKNAYKWVDFLAETRQSLGRCCHWPTAMAIAPIKALARLQATPRISSAWTTWSKRGLLGQDVLERGRIPTGSGGLWSNLSFEIACFAPGGIDLSHLCHASPTE